MGRGGARLGPQGTKYRAQDGAKEGVYAAHARSPLEVKRETPKNSCASAFVGSKNGVSEVLRVVQGCCVGTRPEVVTGGGVILTSHWAACVGGLCVTGVALPSGIAPGCADAQGRVTERNQEGACTVKYPTLTSVGKGAECFRALCPGCLP